MIEIRWLSVDPMHPNSVQMGTDCDGLPLCAVLQYREGSNQMRPISPLDPTLEYTGLTDWSDWRDVTIGGSDDAL